jgi:aspartate aminotransferase
VTFPPLSPRIAALGESATLAVDARVQELTRAGKDVVNLSAGQPDFDTPAYVREAATRAMNAGQTRYTPAGGTPELREAAAAFFREQSGIPAEASNTLISCGAKHALHGALTALLGPGEELLIPVPYWVTYPEQARLAGGVPVPVNPARGLRVTPEDLEAAWTPRTRAMIFNSPNNPTGSVYPPEEVEAIARWCVQRQVVMVSDEIYNRLVFDDLPQVSPASLGPEMAALTLTVNGVSKSHAMTGWRIGFLTGPRHIIAAVARFQGQTSGNPSSVSQAAALAALGGPEDDIAVMRRAYARRRDLAMECLTSIRGVEVDVPGGAFYAFPRMTEAVTAAGGSSALAARLVDEGVALVPGIAFGADHHLRLSFACSEELLGEGLDRLARGLAALVPGTV